MTDTGTLAASRTVAAVERERDAVTADDYAAMLKRLTECDAACSCRGTGDTGTGNA